MQHALDVPLDYRPRPGRPGQNADEPGAKAPDRMTIWLPVRDARAEHDHLPAAGVRVLRTPVREPLVGLSLISVRINCFSGAARVVSVEGRSDALGTRGA